MKTYTVVIMCTLLFVSACGSLVNRSSAQGAPEEGIDLARIVAAQMKDKPVVYIEKEPEVLSPTVSIETIEQAKEVADTEFMLCDKPPIPGYNGVKTDALTVTVFAFNARGESIDECNRHNRRAAKKIGAKIK